jgi:hypothetical protein
LLAALSRDPESALGWLDRLHPALGDIPVDGALHWSGVCDDCSPWELSVAHQADRTDVRLLLEAQSSPSTAPGHAEAAHRLTGAIATLPGVSLEALQQLEGLFPMGNPDLPMAAYHGLDLSGTTPAAKIYLSPNAHPEGTAFVLRSAAQRLGRERAWEDFERRLGERRVHDINLVSLDLTAASRTRMKVYIRQRHADLRGLDDEYAALGRAPKGQLASGSSACFTSDLTASSAWWSTFPSSASCPTMLSLEHGCGACSPTSTSAPMPTRPVSPRSDPPT